MKTGGLKVLMVAGEVVDPDHFGWYVRNFGRGQLPIINHTLMPARCVIQPKKNPTNGLAESNQ